MTANTSREDINISVAFTGYRPQKLPFGSDLTHPDAIRLRENLKTEYEKLIHLGFRQFLTGGALGSDMMAAEVILELMEKYRRTAKLSHWLCIPCRGHTAKWNAEDRAKLNKIAEKSHVIFVSDTPYYRGCMQVRNHYMVDSSRVLLAVYDGQSGGTHNTVEYARAKQKKVVVINPREFMRIELIETPSDAQLLLMNSEGGEYLK